MAASAGVLTSSFATPPAKAGFAQNQSLLDIGARVTARFAAVRGRPCRWGANVFVARYCDVREALARDLEFRIAPVNAAKMAAVNGPFVLGMDRDATLVAERDLLYRALREVDLAALSGDVARRAGAVLEAAEGGIDVVADYARPIAAATARSLFGLNAPDLVPMMDAARAVFAHIFLNLGNDRVVEARALEASRPMADWLREEIGARRQSGTFGDDMMGALLRATADDDLVRRTLGGMFVGSIDTTAASVAKIVAMIGKDGVLARRVAQDVDDLALVAGYCWEALRRWPHNPVILRQAVGDTSLGGTDVKAGDTIWLITAAAMFDASVFPAPLTIDPARPPRSYLHFGGGLHPCAGRAVNDFQIPLLVQALVRRGIRRVAPIEWAGPFPDHLRVDFNRG